MSKKERRVRSTAGPSGSTASISQHSQPRPDFVQRTPVDIPEDKQQRIAHFRGRVSDIPSVDMPAVQQLVRDAGSWEETELFHRDIIQQGLQKILHLLHPGAGRIPKDVQIDAVHALIFGQSDVLMVARTGEGKSLVFQAFAMLTGQVTLQIVPLNRLGIEQSDDIERMNRVQVEASGEAGEPIICSVAVTAEENDRNPGLYQEIAEGKYQHIIMVPEQASHPGFRKLISRPEVRNRIGLVAIDEVHFVSKWQDFRLEYVQLFELREILPIDTVWLGASATVSKETETFVLDRAGFRPVGDKPWCTKVIRSSIDRPDTCYILKKIPRERLSDFDLLYFVVRGAATQMTTLEDIRKATEKKSQTGEATPDKIQKTMIFVDGRQYVKNAVDTIRKWLIAMTRDSPARKYTLHGEGGSIDVCEVVQSYTSNTAKSDQELRYCEFSQIGAASKIRIMVTTTALSTGLNIPDIAIVVQWKFPITKDLEDAVQRLGRVGGRVDLRGVGEGLAGVYQEAGSHHAGGTQRGYSCQWTANALLIEQAECLHTLPLLRWRFNPTNALKTFSSSAPVKDPFDFLNLPLGFTRGDFRPIRLLNPSHKEPSVVLLLI